MLNFFSSQRYWVRKALVIKIRLLGEYNDDEIFERFEFLQPLELSISTDSIVSVACSETDIQFNIQLHMLALAQPWITKDSKVIVTFCLLDKKLQIRIVIHTFAGKLFFKGFCAALDILLAH